MEQLVYLNGTLLPRSQAAISPFDHGFLYGYALFESMRAYNGYIFRLRQHIDRLEDSAALIGLPLGSIDLEKACYETVQANRLNDARVRLTVSMGEGENIPDPPLRPQPTVFIVATDYTPLPPETYKRGFNAIVSRYIRQNSRSPLARVKSANYINNLLARREAKDAGADEALLLNERGLLCEGSTSNIFLVRGDSIITPSDECGCLPGITRRAVVELCTEVGIGVELKEVQSEELFKADGAFITNSLLELMPIRRIDDQSIGSISDRGRGTEITERLTAAYGELVAKEGALLP